MTFPELQTFFRAIIGDDKLDDTVELNLANIAKAEIEDERDWEILKNLDESQSSSSGDTYKTNPKTLPTGYRHTVTLKNGHQALFVGDDRTPYLQIPFEARERYKNSAKRFYVDLANSRYYISATGVSGTHHHWYIKGANDIEDDSATLWAFPTRYDPIIAFRMAELFYPVNTGEKIRAWDDRWAIQYRVLKEAMVRWNARLQMGAARNDVSGLNDLSSYPDAIDTRR